MPAQDHTNDTEDIPRTDLKPNNADDEFLDVTQLAPGSTATGGDRTTKAMAGQAEPLRLSDVDGGANGRLSHDETSAVSIRDANVPIRDTVLVDGSTPPPLG